MPVWSEQTFPNAKLAINRHVGNSVSPLIRCDADFRNVSRSETLRFLFITLILQKCGEIINIRFRNVNNV